MASSFRSSEAVPDGSAVELIAELGRKAASPAKLLDQRRTVTFYDGEQVLQIPKEPVPLVVTCTTLPSFAEYLTRPTHPHGGEVDAVFVSLDSVRASYYDGGYLTASVRYEPTPTAAFEELRQARENGVTMPPLEFVRWARRYLREAFDSAMPGLLTRLNNVRWSTTDTSLSGSSAPTNESMGRSIERAVAGLDDLPDAIWLSVQALADPATKAVPVLFDIVLHHDSKTIELAARGDSWNAFVEEARSTLLQRVEDCLADSIDSFVPQGDETLPYRPAVLAGERE